MFYFEGLSIFIVSSERIYLDEPSNFFISQFIQIAWLKPIDIVILNKPANYFGNQFLDGHKLNFQRQLCDAAHINTQRETQVSLAYFDRREHKSTWGRVRERERGAPGRLPHTRMYNGDATIVKFVEEEEEVAKLSRFSRQLSSFPRNSARLYRRGPTYACVFDSVKGGEKEAVDPPPSRVSERKSDLCIIFYAVGDRLENNDDGGAACVCVSLIFIQNDAVV